MCCSLLWDFVFIFLVLRLNTFPRVNDVCTDLKFCSNFGLAFNIVNENNSVDSPFWMDQVENVGEPEIKSVFVFVH